MSWPENRPDAHHVRGEEERKWEQGRTPFLFPLPSVGLSHGRRSSGRQWLGSEEDDSKESCLLLVLYFKKEVWGSFFNTEKIPQF